MFTPVRNNQVVKFRILIEDVLLPFWSLACHLLPPNVILRKYAPSIYEDAKNLDFNSIEEDKRELVADALEVHYLLIKRRNHYLFLQFVKHMIIEVSFTYQM